MNAPSHILKLRLCVIVVVVCVLREISLGWPRSISCLAGSVCPRLLPSNCWPVGYIARLHCLTFDPHKYSPPLTIWCKPQPRSKYFALLHQVWLPMHLFLCFCLDWQFSPPILCGGMCWHFNDINNVGFVWRIGTDKSKEVDQKYKNFAPRCFHGTDVFLF